MEDWAGLYKFARLGLLALSLTGIAIWLYLPRHRAKFEEPAIRMLSDDDIEERIR